VLSWTTREALLTYLARQQRDALWEWRIQRLQWASGVRFGDNPENPEPPAPDLLTGDTD
jgi:hypothetical protein